MADQASWSAGFFAFNIACSLTLSTSEFAALAVVTSVAFILIAVVRAGAINARVVAGARVDIPPELTLSSRAAAKWAGAASFVASCVLLVILVGDVDNTLLGSLVLLGVILILSDAPHQLLIFRSYYLWAACIALTYAALGLAVFIVQHLISATILILLWSGTGLILLIGGTLFVRSAMGSTRSTLDVTAFSWRLAAEALYVGVSGQLAILMLYLLSSGDASAGFRYSYALVFAPAFMVIQGLSPLFIKSLAKLRHGRQLAFRSGLWSIFVTAALGSSALGAMVISNLFPNYEALVVARDFILPVGLAVLSGQVLEGVTSASRFMLSPKVLHRLRVWMVGLDIALQVIGVVFFDVQGLVVAICIVAAIKALICVILALILLRRKPGTRLAAAESH
ncbi:hypothetical protein HQO38_02740 [Rhodococcus fascians]|nr:hypothetical protein [Rhodococcus fascians]MBY4138175.1 hypothetical protein [Rhodococcus fascians]MBY4216118.1 hypothetical protein [Rhodococcus fascians]MBY4220651.1 hypothetical protein [Rhodococcus fascians]MBY4230810.1 hypothetical protein [Rhodococcus fascians]